MSVQTENPVLSITERQTVDSYPYGSLRCTAFFSVEFDSTRGFRHVFQTINPKNGKENRPKKSTYAAFCYLETDPANGHILTKELSLSGFSSINTTCAFIAKHYDDLKLTDSMREYLYMRIVASIRANAVYMDCKDQDKLKEAIEPAVRSAVKGIKEKTNVFGDIMLPLEVIDGLRK